MDFTWKIGGAQGDGILRVGETFARILHGLGYYCFAYRFPVQEGHVGFRVRVGEILLRTQGGLLDMLVAMDQQTLQTDLAELAPGGILVYDQNLVLPAATPEHTLRCAVPFSALAADAGAPDRKAGVALGITAGLLGMSENSLGALNDDSAAANRGFTYVATQGWKPVRGLPMMPDLPHHGRLFLSGTEALALGAQAGGCRFLSTYPSAPALEFVNRFQAAGGAVLKGRDESAAMDMAIGAAYSGSRAMTTVGPSVDSAALDLATGSRTPLVLLHVQTHGAGSGRELSRIVLAPGTVEECFYYADEAFSLAEKYRCPVVLSVDTYSIQSWQSVDPARLELEEFDRGLTTAETQLKRFGGRRFPGAAGVESGEATAPKSPQFDPDSLGLHYTGPAAPELLLISWGSTYGAVAEARRELYDSGMRAAHLHLPVLVPFPANRVSQAVSAAGRVVVVEQGPEAPLAELVRQHGGSAEKLTGFAKSVEQPVLKADVLAAAKGFGRR